MPKAMKYRELSKRLRDLGCTITKGKGDHRKVHCPCGKHSATIVEQTEVSQGVVVHTTHLLTCLTKGWSK